MSVDAWKDQLTLEEKAALTSGSEFWYTMGVDRLGIRRVMVSLTTFVGMSPDHDTVMKMAATWAERHGATQ